VHRNLPLLLVALAALACVAAFRVLTQRRPPDVPFVATPPDVADAMLQLAEVTKDDVVYDLGCGDGRIVVAAAKKYGCKAVGVDIDPERVREACANASRAGVGHLVTIRQADLFDLDLSPATVVTLFLMPDVNARLVPQLERLRPGSRIVSHQFSMGGVKPRKVLQVHSRDDQLDHTVYLWVTPLEKEAK
jgi:SAM-dependent methyltransferase